MKRVRKTPGFCPLKYCFSLIGRLQSRLTHTRLLNINLQLADERRSTVPVKGVLSIQYLLNSNLFQRQARV